VSIEDTIAAARAAGLQFTIERGQCSIVLTVNEHRWILRDDSELDIMLTLHARLPVAATSTLF
jgi:hypothetical protein